MPTVVNVTAEHIANGERSSCSHCPVALAVADAFPGATDIWVGGVGLLMNIGGHDTEALMPGEVEEFVHAFDDGYAVEPFTFTVDLEEVSA